MAPSGRPKWAEYEALAHTIVKELDPISQVTHNDHILGMDSEAQRQIDISVRYTYEDVENLMIIQVKDYKRRADVNTVGQFRAVMDDVGAQKGVLICSGGFSKTAITYARSRGIYLWSLADAKSKHWTLELTVPILWNKMIPALRVSTKFKTSSQSSSILMRKDGQIDLWTSNGTQFSLTQEFETKWTAGQLELDASAEHTFPIEQQLYIDAIRLDDTPEKLPIDISVAYKVRRETYLAQLSPLDYRGIIDHLDANQFLPTHVNLDIPPLSDDIWTRILDPSRIAVKIKGSFFTVDDSRIENPQWITGNLRELTQQPIKYIP